MSISATEDWNSLLCQLWSTYLSIEVIDSDDFWALGGDSLIAARIAADVNELAPGTMRLRHFFEYATVAEQAALFGARDGAVERT